MTVFGGPTFSIWCNCTLKVDKKGVAALEHHQNTDKHQKYEKHMGNQRRFTSQESNLVISLGNEITLTSEENVVKAECIEALNCRIKQIFCLC